MGSSIDWVQVGFTPQYWFLWDLLTFVCITQLISPTETSNSVYNLPPSAFLVLQSFCHCETFDSMVTVLLSCHFKHVTLFLDRNSLFPSSVIKIKLLLILFLLLMKWSCWQVRTCNSDTLNVFFKYSQKATITTTKVNFNQKLLFSTHAGFLMLAMKYNVVEHAP